SLLTHIDEQVARDLLSLFRNHLSHGGVCVVTTHGRRSMEWFQSQKDAYGGRPAAKSASRIPVERLRIRRLHPSVRLRISVVTHERMRQLAAEVGGWEETLFLEHGWDNHQDGYAFST